MKGASGGEGRGSYASGYGGHGAIISAVFMLTEGDVYEILVGEKGKTSSRSSDGVDSGGGGGSFVSWMEGSTARPLVVAGGGGGSEENLKCLPQQDASLTEEGHRGSQSSSCGQLDGGNGGSGGNGGFRGSNKANDTGCAGGGFYTAGEAQGNQNSGNPGIAYVDTPSTGWTSPSGKGGYNDPTNAFGGGGSDGHHAGGGGGGYSGGGAGGDDGPGGGGGSFVDSSATNVERSVGNRGNGQIAITWDTALNLLG